MKKSIKDKIGEVLHKGIISVNPDLYPGNNGIPALLDDIEKVIESEYEFIKALIENDPPWKGEIYQKPNTKSKCCDCIHDKIEPNQKPCNSCGLGVNMKDNFQIKPKKAEYRFVNKPCDKCAHEELSPLDYPCSDCIQTNNTYTGFEYKKDCNYCINGTANGICAGCEHYSNFEPIAKPQ